jgi:hypothetical protein
MDKDTDMPSPAAADSTSEMKKGTFPAVAMAEASLLSQQATLRKACNFVALFGFQHENYPFARMKRNWDTGSKTFIG